MEFGSILSPQDADRAERTFERLRFHNISSPVLTGGIALEFQLLRRGLSVQPRPFHDIDFLADSLDHIPGTLSADFWFRHVHPKSLPGQNAPSMRRPRDRRAHRFFSRRQEHDERAEIADVCGAHAMYGFALRPGAHAARLCMDLSVGGPRHASMRKTSSPVPAARRRWY